MTKKILKGVGIFFIGFFLLGLIGTIFPSLNNVMAKLFAMAIFIVIGFYVWRSEKINKKIKIIIISIIGLMMISPTISIIKDVSSPTPIITIENHEKNVFSDQITISGTINPVDATLKINGEQVAIEGGHFSRQISLNQGENKISLFASYRNKNKSDNIIISRELTEEEKAIAQKKKEAQEAENKAKAEAEEKERQIALSKMVKEVDDMQGIIWYYDQNTPQTRNTNNVSMYFGVNKENVPTLRFRVSYAGGDWLFINRYIFKIFDVTTDYVPSEIKRDNSNTVWEWSDEKADSMAIAIAKLIIESKESKIRYQGKDYYKDRVITEAEKTSLENVLNAYQAMGGKL
ncbi:MAG: hypothetical protein PHT51_00385 [Patescibacteria group bacterium]|nr:hypothetical protein [Patescibacteria group bacterium]MDD4611048.1 hypothetical protein [Patescibacteria group bacterium]